MPKRNNLFTCN